MPAAPHPWSPLLAVSRHCKSRERCRPRRLRLYRLVHQHTPRTTHRPLPPSIWMPPAPKIIVDLDIQAVVLQPSKVPCNEFVAARLDVELQRPARGRALPLCVCKPGCVRDIGTIPAKTCCLAGSTAAPTPLWVWRRDARSLVAATVAYHGRSPARSSAQSINLLACPRDRTQRWLARRLDKIATPTRHAV